MLKKISLNAKEKNSINSLRDAMTISVNFGDIEGGGEMGIKIGVESEI